MNIAEENTFIMKNAKLKFVVLLSGIAISTGFSQERKPAEKQHNTTTTQQAPANNRQTQQNTGAPGNGSYNDRNSTNGNRVIVAPSRTGPGAFRTSSGSEHPVREPYQGAPRYTQGVPAYGKRIQQPGSNYRSIEYNGKKYRYNNGVFYYQTGAYFQVVNPPAGIHIYVLPLGYRRIYVNAVPYYYFNGVFYNVWGNSEYIVIDPPIGARLPELPNGARLVIINGQSYYELDGTFYTEEYTINNEVVYTVVGVHNVLDETYIHSQVLETNTVRTLPAGCRKVNINGQILYVSPDLVYYQEVIGVNGAVYYQIVGNIAN